MAETNSERQVRLLARWSDGPTVTLGDYRFVGDQRWRIVALVVRPNGAWWQILQPAPELAGFERHRREARGA